MKIAVSGKGGTGKTTLSALLVEAIASDGKRVLAVDADPDPALAHALGFPDADRLTPISRMKDLIDERMASGGGGGFYKLNPRVEDIPEKFALARGNIKLVCMGYVEEGGAGCMCPANSFLKNLLGHILLNEGDWVVADMPAGIEHLGRATARAVDALLVTVEPSPKAAKTAERVRGLAADIGISKIAVVATKVRQPGDLAYVKSAAAGLPVIGYVPFAEALQSAERKGISRVTPDFAPPERIREIIEGIKTL